MNLQELEHSKEKYQEVLAQLQRLQGEEAQLEQERERLVQKLQEIGFESKAQLEEELNKVALEIQQLKENLDNDIRAIEQLGTKSI